VPEWAYGVTEWFELGLYVPLYSFTKDYGSSLNGFKIRTLFAVPEAAKRTFFYGANFEFSFNAKQWDAKRFTSEIRPIVGWHLGDTDIIINPILDNSYIGLKNLDLAPGSRCKIRNVMSLLFNHGRRHDLCERNPIEWVRQSAKRRASPEILTTNEVQSLLANLRFRERTLVLLAVTTGLRRSEIFALK